MVQQRFIQNDLSGHLLCEFRSLGAPRLPSIAEMPQDIDLGGGRIHRRRLGDVLHPARESRETLEMQRLEMGSMVFAAHHQQQPTPRGGAMLQSAWFEFYERPARAR